MLLIFARAQALFYVCENSKVKTFLTMFFLTMANGHNFFHDNRVTSQKLKAVVVKKAPLKMNFNLSCFFEFSTTCTMRKAMCYAKAE